MTDMDLLQVPETSEKVVRNGVEMLRMAATASIQMLTKTVTFLHQLQSSAVNDERTVTCYDAWKRTEANSLR